MSSSRQGFLRHVRLPPGLFRAGLNLWPPFFGAGVRVTRVSEDFREVDVTLKLGVLNRNYFGTQFGGSMFAMTDPFFALMMLQNLGPDYVVWDKSGSILYLRPGRGDVFVRFRLPAEAVSRARRATARGGKHQPSFSVDVVDSEGEAIARVNKVLYIRRRQPAPRAARAEARVGSGAGHRSDARARVAGVVKGRERERRPSGRRLDRA